MESRNGNYYFNEHTYQLTGRNGEPYTRETETYWENGERKRRYIKVPAGPFEEGNLKCPFLY